MTTETQGPGFVITDKGSVRADLIAALVVMDGEVTVRTTIPLFLRAPTFTAWEAYNADPHAAAEEIAADLWGTEW